VAPCAVTVVITPAEATAARQVDPTRIAMVAGFMVFLLDIGDVEDAVRPLNPA
jgi:hypothetical protein